MSFWTKPKILLLELYTCLCLFAFCASIPVSNCPPWFAGSYFVADHSDQCVYYHCVSGTMLNGGNPFRCAPGAGVPRHFRSVGNPCILHVSNCKPPKPRPTWFPWTRRPTYPVTTTTVPTTTTTEPTTTVPTTTTSVPTTTVPTTTTTVPTTTTTVPTTTTTVPTTTTTVPTTTLPTTTTCATTTTTVPTTTTTALTTTTTAPPTPAPTPTTTLTPFPTVSTRAETAEPLSTEAGSTMFPDMGSGDEPEDEGFLSMTTAAPSVGGMDRQPTVFPNVHIDGGFRVAHLDNIVECINICVLLDSICQAVEFDTTSATCWLHTQATVCSATQRVLGAVHIRFVTC